jgi:type IV secretory pathway TrbD component
MNMVITLLFMTTRNTRRRIVSRVGPARIVQIDLNNGSCQRVVSLFDGMLCCIVVFELMGRVIAGSGVLIPI